MKSIYLLLSFLILISACWRNGESSQLRVVGGKTMADAPSYFATIYGESENAKTFCGGAVVGSHAIVTAAHCVSGSQGVFYVAQGKKASVQKPSDAVKVTAVLVHPLYQPQNFANDIAVMFVDEPFPEGSAIDLNGSPDIPGKLTTLMALGFGNTTTIGQLYADSLQQIDLQMVETQICQGLMTNVSDKQLCAGDIFNGGSDSCQGDSGGPLILPGDHPQLLGIVSFGRKCAQKQKPGIYTRISAYRDWIVESIESISAGTAPLADLARAYCYTPLAFQEKFPLETGEIALSTINNLNLKQMQPLTDELKAQLSEFKEFDRCSFKTLAGESLALEHYRSVTSTFPEQTFAAVLRSDRGAYFVSVEKKSVVFFNCKNKPDDALPTSFAYFPQDNFFQYSSDYASGWGENKLIQREFGYGLSSVAPTEKTTIQSRCGNDEFSVEIHSVEADSFARVELDDGGERWLKLVVSPQPVPSKPSLGIKVYDLGSKKILMQVENLSQVDLFTWRLHCPFQFKLKDEQGNLYQSIPSTSGSQATFNYPMDRNGYIPQGLSRTFQMEYSGISKRKLRSQSCTINGMKLALVWE